jgi:DNA-binding NarL/FixJ family response regulator
MIRMTLWSYTTLTDVAALLRGYGETSDWTCSCGRGYRVSVAPLVLTEYQERESEPLVVLPEAPTLSDFQIQVLALIAGGMTDRGVAQALHVPVNRVRYAVRDLITRLSAHNRAEAVFIAARRGLLASFR